MTKHLFTHSQDQLHALCDFVTRYAKSKGASDAAVDVSEGAGLSVSVRKGAVETIERNQDKGLSVTIYLGSQRGNASTSDFSKRSLEDTVEAALAIARYTAQDDCAALPDEALIEKNPRDLQLCYPWQIDAQQAIEFAKQAEAAALAVSSQISNSEGASVSAQTAHFFSTHTHGFAAGYAYSRHHIACAPIARESTQEAARAKRKSNPAMQRDDWYTSSRDPKELAHPSAVGDYAARRALARLGARSLPTRRCPVLFEAPLAVGLLGAFAQAVSGGALYRQSSFLLNSLNTQVFAPHIQIHEDPFQLGGMGSAPFDDEGVKTHARALIQQGVVQGYFLSSYTARKLGMQTTGNSGGSHNLSLTSLHTQKNDNFVAMLKKMGTGLLVTELMGQGVNYVTGDYSRGASGFWVEKGEIAYPVEEITIAGNLKTMFMQMVAVGADVSVRGAKQTGSILIEEMMVAGASSL